MKHSVADEMWKKYFITVLFFGIITGLTLSEQLKEPLLTYLTANQNIFIQKKEQKEEGSK